VVVAGVLPIIIEALLDERWLLIGYENHDHEEKHGKVSPAVI